MMMAVNNTTMNNIKIIFNFGHNQDERGGGGVGGGGRGYVYVKTVCMIIQGGG